MKFYVTTRTYKKPSSNRFIVGDYLKFNYRVLVLTSLLFLTILTLFVLRVLYRLVNRKVKDNHKEIIIKTSHPKETANA